MWRCYQGISEGWVNRQVRTHLGFFDASSSNVKQAPSAIATSANTRLRKDIVNYCEEVYKVYGRYQAGKIYAKFSPTVSYPTKIPHTDVDYR